MPDQGPTERLEAFVCRPTRKAAWFWLWLAAAAICLVYWLYFRFVPGWPPWSPLWAFSSLIPAAISWLDSRRYRLILTARDVRLEAGLFSTTTRSIDLAAVRDARPQRTLLQRLWNVGTLIVEGPDSGARLEIRDIDAPARCAKQILASAEAARRPSPPTSPQGNPQA
jgi:uncharacterized membrane protein YdbT with pleckstrin-like domain